jgi:TPP-dependent 2-oxoacid decarboxylase
MATMTGEDVLLLSREEVARKAQDLYEQTIRAEVETPTNIGKMVIIDIGTGDFGVDELGFDSANVLRRKNPNARLFGIRIGYDVAASLGGMMKRTAP